MAVASAHRTDGVLSRPAHTERRAWTIALVGVAGWAVWRAGADPGELLNPRGRSQIAQFFSAAVQPRLDAGFVELAIREAGVTLGYALVGTALSCLAGMAIALVLAERPWSGLHGTSSGSRAAHTGVRAAIAVPRSVHELVVGLLLVNVLGLDPMVAVLAIAVPFSAVAAKVFAEVLDETPRDAEWALRAAGAGRIQSMALSTIPSAVGDLLSYGFYRFECAIRSAAVLGIIGAGGLGFQLALSFQSLEYDEMWTMLWALIILSGLADRLSAFVRHRRNRIVGDLSVDVGAPDTVPGSAGRRDPLLRLTGLGLVVATVVSWWRLDLDVRTLWSPRTRREVAQLADGVWPPELDDGFGGLLGDSLDTIALAVLALLLAWPVASLLAFVAARSTSGRPVSAVRRGVGLGLRFVMLVMRAVPPPVWAFLAVFAFRPGIWAGAVGLGIYTFGVLGRLQAEAVEHVDRSGADALVALGGSRFAVFVGASLPTLASRFTALGLYRWEVAVRETVAVGVVGAAGLGRRLVDETSRFDYDAVTTTLIALIVITVAADVVSAQLRRVLR